MSIVLNIIADANLKGLKNAIKEFETLKTTGQKASFAISKAALPASAALAGLAAAGFAAAKAAAEEEVAMKKLAFQISSSTKATDSQIQANEDFINSLQYSSAVSDDLLRPALSSLVVATKDLGKAQDLLGTALDVSAATGADLGTVSDALSKGFAGNMRALSQLSPELKTAIKNGADFSDVLKLLEENFGGASEAAANTAAGGMARVQIAFDDAKETIGTALLPYMIQFADALEKAGKWIKNNTGLFFAFAFAAGGISVALVAAKGAMILYNGVAALTTAANTALATSGFAVQISTGVGIATAIAGAAALAGIGFMIYKATNANYEYAASSEEVAKENGYVTASLEAVKRAKEEAAEADRKAAAAAERAKTAAERAKAAAKQLFQDTKQALKDAKNELQQYASSLAETVKSWADLSSAFSVAMDSETAYQDALKERIAAYEELNKLQASGLYTMDQMAAATERVAKAEGNLNTAQSQRKSYAQQFADQIAAAKKFSTQLQQLIGMGLGKAGLAQLMNLGPIAGSQVAADLLTGTGAMTVGSLERDLGIINQSGMDLGGSAIAGDMSLLNQAKAGQTGNNVYITVTSADPNAVVDALKRYMKTNGKVPIKVSG